MPKYGEFVAEVRYDDVVVLVNGQAKREKVPALQVPRTLPFAGKRADKIAGTVELKNHAFCIFIIIEENILLRVHIQINADVC